MLRFYDGQWYWMCATGSLEQRRPGGAGGFQVVKISRAVDDVDSGNVNGV